MELRGCCDSVACVAGADGLVLGLNVPAQLGDIRLLGDQCGDGCNLRLDQEPCAAGWEKGQIEKNVQDASPRLWQQMPDFPDLAALNAWLEHHYQNLWRETPHGTLPGTIADIWAAEQAALMALPGAFDGFVDQSKRVSPTCLITFERNRYSVPASFANRPVSLRIYPE